MKKKLTLLAVILALIVGTDQASKKYVSSTFQLHESREVIPDFFHLTYIHNRGAAFGFLSNSDNSLVIPFFIVITLVAMAALLWLFYQAPAENISLTLGLSLLLAGAMGNFIDRLLLGQVVDFFDFHWYQHHWPAFNIADSAITVGVFLLLIDIIRGEEKETAF